MKIFSSTSWDISPLLRQTLCKDHNDWLFDAVSLSIAHAANRKERELPFVRGMTIS